MKKKFFLAVCSAFLLCSNMSQANIFDEYDPDDSDDFLQINYMKLGGGFISLGQTSSFLPVVGIGRRLECFNMGIDYSATLGYQKGLIGNNRSIFFYSIPKILCISFLDTSDTSSFYFGGGTSWGGVVNKNNKRIFHGIMGEAAIGYEMQRNSCMRSFIELDLSQPLIAAYKKGQFPSPTLQIFFGLGF